jgi:hypothetical protein
VIGANHDGSTPAATRQPESDHWPNQGSLRSCSGLNLEVIEQYKDPIFQDPRAVWLDLTLSIRELEAALWIMKKAWWP